MIFFGSILAGYVLFTNGSQESRKGFVVGLLITASLAYIMF